MAVLVEMHYTGDAACATRSRGSDRADARGPVGFDSEFQAGGRALPGEVLRQRNSDSAQVPGLPGNLSDMEILQQRGKDRFAATAL